MTAQLVILKQSSKRAYYIASTNFIYELVSLMSYSAYAFLLIQINRIASNTVIGTVPVEDDFSDVHLEATRSMSLLTHKNVLPLLNHGDL